MILEGIVTTTNADGTVNVTPMGPIVDESMDRLLLRPFRTSTTYANLRRCGQGVFHVTDDVELLARAAIGRLDDMPPLRRAERIDGWILADACRWYAFEVRTFDDRQDRTRIEADVVDRGRIRDFFGFHRARHAVVEAAILATRVDLLPAHEIEKQLAHLAVIVDKTAGERERRAFDLLCDHVRAVWAARSHATDV